MQKQFLNVVFLNLNQIQIKNIDYILEMSFTGEPFCIRITFASRGRNIDDCGPRATTNNINCPRSLAMATESTVITMLLSTLPVTPVIGAT